MNAVSTYSAWFTAEMPAHLTGAGGGHGLGRGDAGAQGGQRRGGVGVRGQRRHGRQAAQAAAVALQRRRAGQPPHLPAAACGGGCARRVRCEQRCGVDDTTRIKQVPCSKGSFNMAAWLQAIWALRGSLIVVW